MIRFSSISDVLVRSFFQHWWIAPGYTNIHLNAAAVEFELITNETVESFFLVI